MSSEANLTAEGRFRLAFERLKADKPRVLTQGTPVSQNNVALEAGCTDPSALRKPRFPSLVREIQAYVELRKQEQPSKRQEKDAARRSRNDLKAQVDEMKVQRDLAQSKTVSAERRIVELTHELKVARARLDELQPPPTPLFGR